MPTISEFYLVVGIAPIAVIAGRGPARVRSMVVEGAALHQQELLEDWRRCRAGRVPERIAPLD